MNEPRGVPPHCSHVDEETGKQCYQPAVAGGWCWEHGGPWILRHYRQHTQYLPGYNRTREEMTRALDMYLGYLEKTGSMSKARAAVCVDVKTIERWRKVDPDFARREKEAREAFGLILKEQAIQLATEGQYEPIHKDDGSPFMVWDYLPDGSKTPQYHKMRLVKPADTNLMRMMLKCYFPAEFDVQITLDELLGKLSATQIEDLAARLAKQAENQKQADDTTGEG